MDFREVQDLLWIEIWPFSSGMWSVSILSAVNLVRLKYRFSSNSLKIKRLRPSKFSFDRTLTLDTEDFDGPALPVASMTTLIIDQSHDAWFISDHHGHPKMINLSVKHPFKTPKSLQTSTRWKKKVPQSLETPALVSSKHHRGFVLRFLECDHPLLWLPPKESLITRSTTSATAAYALDCLILLHMRFRNATYACRVEVCLFSLYTS